MTATVPLSQPYTVSAAVPTGQAPTKLQALTQFFVELIARPMAADLRADGYEVDQLEHIIYGSLVTFVETSPGGTTFIAQFPHPPGPPPPNTVFTVTTCTAELVGGSSDGLVIEPRGRDWDHLVLPAIEAPGIVEESYTRHGYHLTGGHWVYQLARTPAPEETA